MCFDKNINGNKDDKFLEVWLASCVTVRETHFTWCFVNSQRTEISLKYINFIDKIKQIFYLQVRNSITHLRMIS
jgi:hypothetical protein